MNNKQRTITYKVRITTEDKQYMDDFVSEPDALTISENDTFLEIIEHIITEFKKNMDNDIQFLTYHGDISVEILEDNII